MNKKVSQCLLCYDAPCNKTCKNAEPERIFRAAYLSNLHEAIRLLPEEGMKVECPFGFDSQYLVDELYEIKKEEKPLVYSFEPDISTDICGVHLENPFLLSSSVVASNYEMCKRAFEAGFSGVAFKTISLMDMHEASPRYSALKAYDNLFYGFKNIEQLSDHSLGENLSWFKQLKEEFPSKVIIASIMGRNEAEWTYLARKVEEAGADVVELNFSCPNMEEEGTGVDVGIVPALCEKYCKAARKGTKLPILAKMTPNITDMRIPALASIEGGADGIAAINTVKSIINVDVDTLTSEPNVNGKSSIGGYSGAAIKPIALRFVSELYNDPIIGKTHISGMGGIYTWKDALEFMLLGASSVQMTTSVMEFGTRIIEDLISGLKHYMVEKNIHSLKKLIGAASKNVVDASDLLRDTVLFPTFNYDKCIGCGRCYLSCRDGGHQAITLNDEHKPIMNGKICVGCHLCKLICPTGAIGQANKRISRRIL